MNKTEVVRAMQKYIDDHLDEKITAATLAKVALYSPWYSYRIFIEVLNMSPADYIRRLKLTHSALKLRDSTIKVVDAAYEAGYESVDGFQRAFHKEFGTNPYEYAQNPIPIGLFTPFKVYEKKETKIMNKVKSIFISVVSKPERKVIIKRGKKAKEYFTYCEEVGCDVWGIIKSISSIGTEPVSMWLPSQYVAKGTSTYVQGAEVALDYNGKIPEGFDVIQLPETTYLQFQGEPFLEEDYCEAIEALEQAIENYRPEALGYEWNEDAPDIQLEPIGERGYIELKAVRKLSR